MEKLNREQATTDKGVDDRCRDFDEDCLKVRSFLDCFLYDPEQGNCPFLK